MSATLKYLEPAEAELVCEVGFLELRAKGLGRRFLAEVRRIEELIIRFPEMGRELRPGIRKARLRTFRSSLIYAIAADGLLVVAVAADGRRPEYWLERLEPGG